MATTSANRQHSKALVTLIIGHPFRNQWRALCRANWEAYGRRHAYDVLCFDAPLDLTERAQRRSVSWQKCLILGQDLAQEYERIVWVDSDILINSISAPDVAEGVPLDKVGAVDAWSGPTPQVYAQVLERQFELWGESAIVNHTARDYYRKYGLPPIFDEVVQGGVLVLSPQHHRHVLEHVYYAYEERGGSEWNYEMRPLSYELLNADCVHWIDHRFNTLWFNVEVLHYPFLLPSPRSSSHSNLTNRLRRKVSSLIRTDSMTSLKRACATTALLNSYFLHFAGCAADMELVNQSLTSWRQCVTS